MSLNDEKCKDKDIEVNEKTICDHKKEIHPFTLINCNLEVEIDNRNKTIYLCPGKLQYFTGKILKSCGEVTIRYKGYYSDDGICGKLGIYRIVENGIAVYTHNKLNPKDTDILSFTVSDKCTNKCSELDVIFSYDPWQCLRGCYRRCCN